jgi:hypothetical protein
MAKIAALRVGSWLAQLSRVGVLESDRPRVY